MAIETVWYTMDSKAGVNLNAVITSVTVTNNPTQPEYPGLPHNLGDRVQGNNGSEWLFVVASTTVTAFNFVTIDRNYAANNATTATAVSGVYAFGIAEFQTVGGVTAGNANGGVANAGDAFWALIKHAQSARVNVTASVSTSPGAKLYVSGSIPGFLTTSTTTSTASTLQIVGIACAVSATGSGDITVQEIVGYSYPYHAALVSAQAASV